LTPQQKWERKKNMKSSILGDEIAEERRIKKEERKKY
jgi:hypothetical protein